MKLIDLLGNLAGGGLVGIVGQCAIGFLETWREDKASARRINELRAQAEIKTEEGKQLSFAAAQAAEGNTNNGHTWPAVEAIKTLFRPFLTLLLLCFLAWQFTQASPETRAELAGQLSACALGAAWFWFGTRYQSNLSPKR